MRILCLCSLRILAFSFLSYMSSCRMGIRIILISQKAFGSIPFSSILGEDFGKYGHLLLKCMVEFSHKDTYMVWAFTCWEVSEDWWWEVCSASLVLHAVVWVGFASRNLCSLSLPVCWVLFTEITSPQLFLWHRWLFPLPFILSSSVIKKLVYYLWRLHLLVQRDGSQVSTCYSHRRPGYGFLHPY